jgi:hypothetical protein
VKLQRASFSLRYFLQLPVAILFQVASIRARRVEHRSSPRPTKKG